MTLKQANDMLVTFAFVRNPFSRLVSAYYNKVGKPINTENPKFAVIEEIKRGIMIKYRNLSPNSNEPTPQSGRNKGLMLIVDGHSNMQSSGTVKENFNGFVTLVDDRYKFPIVSVANMITRPGYESNIKVDAIKLEARREIRKYAPKRRNCYFPEELKLEVHLRIQILL